MSRFAVQVNLTIFSLLIANEKFVLLLASCQVCSISYVNRVYKKTNTIEIKCAYIYAGTNAARKKKSAPCHFD